MTETVICPECECRCRVGAVDVGEWSVAESVWQCPKCGVPSVQWKWEMEVTCGQSGDVVVGS